MGGLKEKGESIKNGTYYEERLFGMGENSGALRG